MKVSIKRIISLIAYLLILKGILLLIVAQGVGLIMGIQWFANNHEQLCAEVDIPNCEDTIWTLLSITPYGLIVGFVAAFFGVWKLFQFLDRQVFKIPPQQGILNIIKNWKSKKGW